MKSEIDASWISFSLIKAEKEQQLTFVMLKKISSLYIKRKLDSNILKRFMVEDFRLLSSAFSEVDVNLRAKA